MASDEHKGGRPHSSVERAAQGLDRLLGGLSGLSRGLARLSGALVVIVAVLVGIEVGLRGLTSISISFTHELSGYALAIVSALSLAYALMYKAHIRIDIFYLGAPVKVRRMLDIFSLVLLNAFSIMLVHAAWGVFALSYTRSSIANTSLGTPLWIPQSVWFIGFVVFAVVAALLFVRVVLSVFGIGPERAEQLVGTTTER